MLAVVHRFRHFHPFVRFFLFLIVLAAIVAVIAVLVRWVRRRHEPAGEPAWPKPTGAIDPAIAELLSAYGRGDMGWPEFAQRASRLGYPVSPDQPPPTSGPTTNP